METEGPHGLSSPSSGAMCTQSRRHFLVLHRCSGLLFHVHLHNVVSSAASSSFYGRGDYGRDRSVYKSPQYYAVWTLARLLSPLLPFPWLHPFISPLMPFPGPLTHRLYSLRKNKSRLKEKRYSLHDKCASSTKSTKNKTDLLLLNSKPRGAKRKAVKKDSP